jgi:pimeloyl-ACP methyl ester carboxylesterase
MRTSRTLLAGAAAALTLVAAPVWAADPVHDSLVYCDGSVDHGASGAVSDAEHRIAVGDPPLPPGVRRSRVRVDGVSTRVIQAGPRTARTAVVFVHGNPGSSRDFDSLVAKTGRFARAVAFDVPGFGRADDRPGGPYTTDGAARFIEDLTKRLRIRHVHLVLHDFGGPWGLEWGGQHGNRLDSVVLIDTGVFIGYYGHPAALVWHTPLAGEVQVGTTTRQSFAAYLQANNPRPLPNRFVNRMYDDFDRPTRCAMLHYYRDVSNPDQMGRQQAASLRKRVRPALVVWGAQDPYVPASLAQTQKQAFPTAEIHVLQGDGHWPFVDEPRRVERLVIPFLRRVVRAGSRRGAR